MAKAKPKENPLISKRVNFPSMQALLDEWVPLFENHYKFNEKQTGEFRHALQTIFSRFLGEATYAAKLGAEKGVIEAFNMMEDPDYYETVKKRRKADRERMQGHRVDRKAEEAERERRKNNPTQKEKLSDIRQAIKYMAYYRKHYHQARSTITKYVDKDGPGILGEFIKDELEMPDAFMANFDVDAYVKAISECDVTNEPKPDKPSIIDDVEDFFDQHTDFDEE